MTSCGKKISHFDDLRDTTSTGIPFKAIVLNTKMGNPNKDSDGASSTKISPAPRMPAMPTETLARKGNQGCCPIKQVAEAIAREMVTAHAHYQAIINEMNAATMPTSLKVTSSTSGFKVMDLFNWSKDKSIFSNGNYSLKRLDMFLKQWKEIQKRLRFHTSSIRLMEREWDILSHGKTTKPSLVKLKASTLQKEQKVTGMEDKCMRCRKQEH